MQKPVDDWPVKPMEPVRVHEAFDSAEFLFQIKWDGVRCLAYHMPEGGIRLFNRRLNERTLQYPDLTEALAFLPPGTVTDGEIVALGDDGKPSFPRALQRDLVKSPAKIHNLIRRLPALYMVFDLLWLEGEPLLNQHLEQRQKMLKTIFKTTNNLHVIDSIEGNGIALFEAVKAEGLEGIVAKQKGSPYLIGQKTPLWRKIKAWRELQVWAGGYLVDEAGRIRSLLVGVEEENGLRYVGAAASGVTQKQWRALQEFFRGAVGTCPFINPPRDSNARWVEPVISLQVRFLEFSPNGSLRNPSIIRFTGGIEL